MNCISESVERRHPPRLRCCSNQFFYSQIYWICGITLYEANNTDPNPNTGVSMGQKSSMSITSVYSEGEKCKKKREKPRANQNQCLRVGGVNEVILMFL